MLCSSGRERRGTFGKSTLLTAADYFSPVPVCEGCVHTSSRGEVLQMDWWLSVLVDISEKVVHTNGQCVRDDRRTTRRLNTTITLASRKTAAIGDVCHCVAGGGGGPSTASCANRRSLINSHRNLHLKNYTSASLETFQNPVAAFFNNFFIRVWI
jgi:hypothetical protein